MNEEIRNKRGRTKHNSTHTKVKGSERQGWNLIDTLNDLDKGPNYRYNHCLITKQNIIQNPKKQNFKQA